MWLCFRKSTLFWASEKALMFSVFSFVYDDLYDEIPGIRSVVSPGRQSEAAAPGEKRIDGPYAPRPDRTFPYSAPRSGPSPHSRTPISVDSCHSILPSTGSSSCPESFFSDQTETENLPTSRDENTYAFAYDSFARLTDTSGITKPEPSRTVSRKKGLTYDANGNLRP